MSGSSGGTRRHASWGFSLDEASQIHGSFRSHLSPPLCPRCATPLSVAACEDGDEELDLATCEVCHQTLLLRFPRVGRREAESPEAGER